MTRSTLFPPTAPSVPAANTALAAVVTLAFDADGVTARASGRLSVRALAVQGNRVVVLDVPGLAGGAATLVGQTATVRVDGDLVLVTYPGSVPTSGTATLLLAERPRGTTKRATNSLAPAPPSAFAYTERAGQTGALTMAVDARTTAVRVERLDGRVADAQTKTPDWRPLLTALVAPGAVTVPLAVAADVPGRRFRAVALRTVGDETVESAPSAEDYRNRPPVSVGEARFELPVGGKTARVVISGLVTDPDGGVVTFRDVAKSDRFGRGSLPAWARLDGAVLVVETSEPREAVTFALAGADERGLSATVDVTLSVYVPDGPEAPAAVEYVP